jgi:hypothetical protein
LPECFPIEKNQHHIVKKKQEPRKKIERNRGRNIGEKNDFSEEE